MHRERRGRSAAATCLNSVELEAIRRRVARQVRGSPRGGYEVTDMTTSRARRDTARRPQTRSPARTAASRPPPRPAPGADGRRPPRRSDPHRFGRVDPDGTVWLITGVRRTRHRLLAGRRHRGRVRAFRPPLRRPAHRGRADGAAAGVRAPATPARSSRRPRHWPRACRRRTCSATSTRWPPG